MWLSSKCLRLKLSKVNLELRPTLNLRVLLRKKKLKWLVTWKLYKSKSKKRKKFWRKSRNYQVKTSVYFSKRSLQQIVSLKHSKKSGKNTKNLSKRKFSKLSNRFQTNALSTHTRLKKSKNLSESSSKQWLTSSTKRKCSFLWSRSGMLCLKT